MATRALANLSHEGSEAEEAPEGDKLGKRPRGYVITGLLQGTACARIPEFLRVESIYRTNAIDVSIDIIGRFSLPKERAKCQSARQWKRLLVRKRDRIVHSWTRTIFIPKTNLRSTEWRQYSARRSRLQANTSEMLSQLENCSGWLVPHWQYYLRTSCIILKWRTR